MNINQFNLKDNVSSVKNMLQEMDELLETTATSIRHEMENHPVLKSRQMKFHRLDPDSVDTVHVFANKKLHNVVHFMGENGLHHVHIHDEGDYRNSEPTSAGAGKTATDALNHIKPYDEYRKKYDY